MDVINFQIIKFVSYLVLFFSVIAFAVSTMMGKYADNPEIQNATSKVNIFSIYVFVISTCVASVLRILPGKANVSEFISFADTIKVIQKVDIAFCAGAFVIFTYLYYLRKYSDKIFKNNQEMKSKIMAFSSVISEISLYAIAIFASLAFILSLFVKN